MAKMIGITETVYAKLVERKNTLNRASLESGKPSNFSFGDTILAALEASEVKTNETTNSEPGLVE